MRIFIKRLFRRIGYRLVRFLVPCIVIITLISCMCFSASALDINANGTVFEVKYAQYYTTNSGSQDSELIETSSGFVNVIPYDGANWFQCRATFDFKDTTTTYGNLKIIISCAQATTSYNYPSTCFLYGIGFSEEDNIYFENTGKSYELNYTGDFTEQFTIISYFENVENLGGEIRTLFFDIEFTPIYSGADSSNFDLYENVEQELLNSQKPALQEGIDFLTSVGGQPTTGMRNGLAVVSQFMTRFLNYNEFRAIYNISLSLGLFAFVVGMAVLIGALNRKKGGK